jgi:hypothetical protein
MVGSLRPFDSVEVPQGGSPYGAGEVQVNFAPSTAARKYALKVASIV